MATETGPVLCLGSFDGVHRGHRAILDRGREEAAQTGAALAVLTFDPLPAQLIHPDFTYVLTPLREKTALLVELGVEAIHVLRFDRPAREMAPADYVAREVLPLRPAAVCCGSDHRFGRNGAGDTALLRRLLEPRGVGLFEVPEFRLFEAPVRSTRVRERLLLGHVRRAAELLGREYRLAGRVVPGFGTGRKLGFPTLNIQVEEPEKLVPADGVYAARAELDGLRPAVLNIGHRPTFQGEKRSIEVHLLDRELAEPPARVAVRFVERLRPERRFGSAGELARHIAADVERARAILAA
ncbi:riboflavin biosynthesis protein RibF [candidate division WOR-3 bacterium]|nr:riboflavin biosynthesis protein RibF [candidate division WOR-3 bacterium]